ncbi:MAG TPA: FtsX-like permease family protein [Pirellulales bacterium]|nr:FtsX-like permease family protein [Pirellulales bacterium]
MTALNQKLWRDAWHLKGQFTAIALVIACGIGTFVMSLSTLESLELTLDAYYQRYRFGHVFAHLKRAPLSLRSRLAEIPGVAAVQTRVVSDVILDVPGLDQPAIGRLISVPERQPPSMNALHLRSGRYIEPGHKGEALVSEAFAAAHGFQPGDKVAAVINGRHEQIVIVGVVLSPEYIYQIRGAEVFPNDRTFGVFWMSDIELAAAFDMKGAFNDLSCYLLSGASQTEVQMHVDRLLDRYGGLGAYCRADQVSNRYLVNELRELRNMGLFAPVIFLLVAAFLLHVVLSRIVGTQREQIAALKAFGYTRREIGLHYLKMVAIVVVAGVLLGTGLGYYLGSGLTNMYTRFFHFPVLEFRLTVAVVAWALAASMLAAVLGTLGAVRRAARLPPAEAMRPEPPATYRLALLERLGLGRFFSPPMRMILRQLERRWFASTLSVLGIAMAAAILVLGSFIADALDDLLELEFQVMHRNDLRVVLVNPTSSRALHEIAHLPGVLRCEPFRAVAVRLRNGHRVRLLDIVGVAPDSRAIRLLDPSRAAVLVPPGGIVLSAKLAETLAAKEGDWLTAEVLEGARPVRRVAVTAVISDFVGIGAYMDLDALHRLLREGDTISGALLDVDPPLLPALYAKLKSTPQVAAVIVKEAMRRSLQATLADSLLRMKAVNIVFATIIAFGVVYNTARISVSERSRELASLRVLGFTRYEISYILLGELALLTLAAIPLGLFTGFGLSWFMAWGYDTEMFRIPLVILPSTYAFASLTVVAAAVVSGLLVRRRLDRLDLVAVLKTRE